MTHFLIGAQDRADSPFNQLANHEQVWEDLTALDEAMQAAGVYVFSRGLQSTDATVTFSATPTGEVVTTEGPFGPTTLAGMWIISCESDDARE